VNKKLSALAKDGCILHRGQSIRLLNSNQMKLEKMDLLKYLELESHEVYTGFTLEFEAITDLRMSSQTVGLLLVREL
jgi:hypothetical protein